MIAQLPPDERGNPLMNLSLMGVSAQPLKFWGKKTKERPGDFNLQMKLAEVYGKHCGDVHRAEKIVRQIEDNSTFSLEQIQFAKNKLKEWREPVSNIS